MKPDTYIWTTLVLMAVGWIVAGPYGLCVGALIPLAIGSVLESGYFRRR